MGVVVSCIIMYLLLLGLTLLFNYGAHNNERGTE